MLVVSVPFVMSLLVVCTGWVTTLIDRRHRNELSETELGIAKRWAMVENGVVLPVISMAWAVSVIWEAYDGSTSKSALFVLAMLAVGVLVIDALIMGATLAQPIRDRGLIGKGAIRTRDHLIRVLAVGGIVAPWVVSLIAWALVSSHGP